MRTNAAKICVPVCVPRTGDLPEAIARAAEVADVIELRLDYLMESELSNAAHEIRELIESRQPRPVILTLRPAEFGGARPIQAEDRLFFRIHNSLLASDATRRDLWDLELDLALVVQKNDWGHIDWPRTICSYHDFVGSPSDLEQIYERMAATPARILKISVQADDATDCLPIFQLLERARSEKREMIAIAMGPAGIMTRILGPSRGSFLTYGSLDSESATAPGQLTARELREVYRIDRIDRQTEVIGIMGKPVGHSLSPHIHNAAFAAAGLNAVYLPFEVRDAVSFMRRMAHPRSRELDWNLRGLSVTSPHKSTVISSLDWVDPAAEEIGAVNTIVVEDNELHGYNTDAPGFIAPLRQKFGLLKDARCAIVGAGGGARAALWALRNEGAQVTLFIRDPERARPVANEFALDCRQLTDAHFDQFEIVINATPLGTRGEREEESAATAKHLGGVRLAYDLVYNPIETRFLREARAAGCETLSGLEMLIAQAVEQFKLWTGQEPSDEVMRGAAQRALGLRFS
jgi:3-dehydroquinate dehydratase/shikimate dehydrogenase